MSAAPVSHPRVGILIVNYFKSDQIVAGLQALRQQSCADDLAVTIVDNSVSESEAARLRGAVRDETLIVSHRNLGYTQGVNLAASNAPPCEFLLLMNPDILVEDKGAIETMTALMSGDPTLGVLACMQRDMDGNVVEIARRYPSLVRQVLRRLIPGRFDEHDLLAPLIAEPDADLAEFDWVQSSFVLVRGDLWERIGGLDESYVIFMADVDLGRRAWRHGMRVAVTGRTEVRADGLRASRGSVHTVLRSRALRVHIRDAFLYRLRNFGDVFVGPPRRPGLTPSGSR